MASMHAVAYAARISIRDGLVELRKITPGGPIHQILITLSFPMSIDTSRTASNTKISATT